MSTTPCKRELPRTVDPRKLATQGADLQGIILHKCLPRLADAVLEIEVPVNVTLSFGRDEQGLSTVTGWAETTASVTCQRCLQPMPLSLQSNIQAGLVWDDEGGRQLPAALDPWVVAGESADLYELVEDELLLALNCVNYHVRDECQGLDSYSTGEIEERKSSPFQVLEQLQEDD